MVAQKMAAFVQLLVVNEQHAPFARGNGLGAVKAEYGPYAEAAGLLPTINGT